MKNGEMRKLIEGGELERLEFKTSLSEWKEAVQTIAAFAWNSGGMVVFGAKPKKVLGVEIGKGTIEDLTNKILQNTDPKVYPKISIEEINRKKLVLVRVEKIATKPVLAFGRPFKRVGKSTVKMSRDEYERTILEAHKNELRFDNQICENADFGDISEEKVKLFLEKSVRERRRDINPNTAPKNALEKLGLIAADGKLTNAAVLVFGGEPQRFFPQSLTRCARFEGIETTSSFRDMKVFSGSLYEQIDLAEKFVLDHIKKAAWIEPGRVEREEKWEYPPDAIREAITNAVAHRDYRSTAHVHVSIFDDRIEVWNPGELPKPLTIEDLKREHKSIPRNPLIANLLFLIKYIERWGTGTNKIIEQCRKHGLPEPIFKEEVGGFAVVFRKLLELNERQKKAIERVKKEKIITKARYVEICGCSERTATDELTDLVRKNVLIRKGKGRGTYYEIST